MGGKFNKVLMLANKGENGLVMAWCRVPPPHFKSQLSFVMSSLSSLLVGSAIVVVFISCGWLIEC